MKQLNSYLYLTNAVVVILLIALFCSKAVPFFNWLLDKDTPSIELCDLVDNESDDEEKKVVEDEDDEIQMSATWATSFSTEETWKLFLTADSPSLYHPEIHTPPPEMGNFFY